MARATAFKLAFGLLFTSALALTASAQAAADPDANDPVVDNAGKAMTARVYSTLRTAAALRVDAQVSNKAAWYMADNRRGPALSRYANTFSSGGNKHLVKFRIKVTAGSRDVSNIRVALRNTTNGRTLRSYSAFSLKAGRSRTTYVLFTWARNQQGIEAVVTSSAGTFRNRAYYFGIRPRVRVIKQIRIGGVGRPWKNADKVSEAELVAAGPVPKFRWIVTNTGDVDLKDVKLRDRTLGASYRSFGNGALAKGKSLTILRDAKLLAGVQDNKVTVRAFFRNEAVYDTDVAFTRSTSGTAPLTFKLFVLDSEGNPQDANTESVAPSLTIGEPIQWTVEIRNTGTVNLTNLAIAGTPITLASLDVGATYAPDDSIELGTVLAGARKTTLTVTGLAGTTQVSASDDAWYRGVAAGSPTPDLPPPTEPEEPPEDPLPPGDDTPLPPGDDLPPDELPPEGEMPLEPYDPLPPDEGELPPIDGLV